MSTITKELAKLFRKITNSEIDAEGNAHVVLSPADSLLINNARIALASLEAEAVAWLLSGGGAKNNVSFDSGNAYADPLREVTPLYTAHPAPVSVPECFKRLLHHAYGMTMGHDWNKGTMAGHHRTKLCRAVEECRAAMLQAGNHTEQHLDMVNSTVIPDGWQLVPKEPTEAMNKAGWAAINEHDAINPTYRAMLAAAPQQEVK